MDVLTLLKDLIRCLSVTPNDAGCQEIVAEVLRGAGFRVEALPFGRTANLWATHGEGGPLIVFNGHTDVVPPGPLEAWSSDPFEPTVRDGQLYGRGASDMKASVAAMTIALRTVAEEGHRGTLALLLTSDEEGAGTDGTARALAALIERGIKIDTALVGEPTSEARFGDAIKSGRRGSMTGDVTIQGVQGHTAYPHLAQNAVHVLAPALADLVALDFGPPEANFPPTTLQVCHLEAGTGASNVIPGQCKLRFNIRFGVGLSAEEIATRVEDVFRRHGRNEPVAWDVSARPFLTAHERLLEAVEGSIVHELGLGTDTRPRRSTAGGTSDARHFAAQDIPVAEFGPLNATIHQVDERVEIACLEPLARIYAGIARRLTEASFSSGG
jgi:succinyl-diaminopimelate desuccinylase